MPRYIKIIVFSLHLAYLLKFSLSEFCFCMFHNRLFHSQYVYYGYSVMALPVVQGWKYCALCITLWQTAMTVPKSKICFCCICHLFCPFHAFPMHHEHLFGNSRAGFINFTISFTRAANACRWYPMECNIAVHPGGFRLCSTGSWLEGIPSCKRQAPRGQPH